jgi:CRISPR/Cas system CMR subunit Cmr4 (Cas7 group RAMP superfamily)
VEAASPLGIGSGRPGLATDRLVARDAYGLPYLPGTSLAGCLRSALGEVLPATTLDSIFGFQSKEDGTGSRLILSSGHLIGPDGKVVGENNGLPDYEAAYLQHLSESGLPQRDHVRINSRGTADAEGHGKFDEQLVPRGVRFVFELRLHGTNDDENHWHQLLWQFFQPFFRLGGGTRKGFGKLSVITIQHGELDLRDAGQREAYLNLPTTLDANLPPAFTTSTAPATAPNRTSQTSPDTGKWKTYELQLTARDFFQFGHGRGGEAENGTYNQKGQKGWVNQKPKREPIVIWVDEKPQLLDGDKAPYLLPATSIKGALSHRTAFHFNKLQKQFIEDQQLPAAPTPQYEEIIGELMDQNASMPQSQEAIQKAIEQMEQLRDQVDHLKVEEAPSFRRYKKELEAVQSDESRPNVGENNDAVRALFGFAVERGIDEKGETESAQRGHVIIDDVFLEPAAVKTKTFSHVMIDRFTGGAKAGALFNEEVASTKEEITLTIHVHEDAFSGENGEKIKAALEEALLDLKSGQLPLGGGAAKGHGIFTGKLITPRTQTP